MITAPMKMIPTAGVSTIVSMIVKETVTAAKDLIMKEIMDMMNATKLLHIPTVMLGKTIVVPDLLPIDAESVFLPAGHQMAVREARQQTGKPRASAAKGDAQSPCQRQSRKKKGLAYTAR